MGRREGVFRDGHSGDVSDRGEGGGFEVDGEDGKKEESAKRHGGLKGGREEGKTKAHLSFVGNSSGGSFSTASKFGWL